MLFLVCSLTEHTMPFLSGKTSSILPRSQEQRGEEQSMMTMTFSTFRLYLLWFHFCLSCNSGRYSRIHRFQNRLEMYWNCLQPLFYIHVREGSKSPGGKAIFLLHRSRWSGVKGSKSFGSLVIGRSFKMASASHITTLSLSSSNICRWKTELRTRLTVHIICSQTPQWWDPAGGL